MFAVVRSVGGNLRFCVVQGIGDLSQQFQRCGKYRGEGVEEKTVCERFV